MQIRRNRKGLLFAFLLAFILAAFAGGVLVSPACAADGSNNSPETALEILPGEQVAAGINFAGDVDWYKITVDHTCSLAAAVTNNSGYITYNLYNASLQKLCGEIVSSKSTISWKVPAGEYYIRLKEYVLGRLTSVTYSFGLKIVYDYDAWGNLRSVTPVDTTPLKVVSTDPADARRSGGHHKRQGARRWGFSRL